jgi:TPR repeat protein
MSGGTQPSPDEEPAIATDPVSEELSTVSDTEEFGTDTNAVISDPAVANCYGSYERKNWSAAFVYCSADAEQGDADAQNKLGSLYDAGRGVAKDNAEAVRWYRKAADQGGASAQYNLGVMYDEGEGVMEDDAEAVRWYRKAADQGRARAQYNLGVMYDEGEGVTEDDAEAVRWYRKAAAQGDADARKRVAELGY